MNKFDQVIAITQDERVSVIDEIHGLLHKELCFTASRYLVRNSVLGPGHERLTDSQRYYACLMEICTYAGAIRDLEYVAMKAKADLLEWTEKLELADKEYEKIRALAEIKNAEKTIDVALLQANDRMRPLDELNKIRLELQDKVRAQYPGGIEQASQDDWIAVAKYRHFKQSTTGRSEMLSHVPLPLDVQTQLGLELNSPDMYAHKAALDTEGFKELLHNNSSLFVKEVTHG